MTTYIWLRLRGRLLWGVVALSLLGLVSLWLEVARGSQVLWGWLGMGSSASLALSVLIMILLFFPLAMLRRRLFERSAVVSGSLRSGVDLFFCLPRSSLVFWYVVLLSCAACLAVQLLRISVQAAAWLGVGWPGRFWLILCALPFVFSAAYLLLCRLAEHAATVGFDVAKRHTEAGASSRDHLASVTDR